MQLAGQVAIITGGSKGIGRAIAAGYAEEGASVVIVARTEVDVETAASEIRSGGGRAIGIAADVSSEADVDAVVSRTLREFGQIDVLVNNAGAIHPRIATVDLELDTWCRVLDVNMTGAFLCARSVLPHMYERGSGKVINISSIGGRKGAWGRAAYRASKAGLISLTETLAAEGKEHGVDVNCICPGATDTEMIRIATGGKVSDDWVESEEIASIAVFLASPASSAITGTSIDAFGETNPLFSTR